MRSESRYWRNMQFLLAMYVSLVSYFWDHIARFEWGLCESRSFHSGHSLNLRLVRWEICRNMISIIWLNRNEETVCSPGVQLKTIRICMTTGTDIPVRIQRKTRISNPNEWDWGNKRKPFSDRWWCLLVSDCQMDSTITNWWENGETWAGWNKSVDSGTWNLNRFGWVQRGNRGRIATIDNEFSTKNNGRDNASRASSNGRAENSARLDSLFEILRVSIYDIYTAPPPIPEPSRRLVELMTQSEMPISVKLG
jgi:hypothetical protein